MTSWDAFKPIPRENFTHSVVPVWVIVLAGILPILSAWSDFRVPNFSTLAYKYVTLKINHQLRNVFFQLKKKTKII